MLKMNCEVVRVVGPFTDGGALDVELRGGPHGVFPLSFPPGSVIGELSVNKGDTLELTLGPVVKGGNVAVLEGASSESDANLSDEGKAAKGKAAKGKAAKG